MDPTRETRFPPRVVFLCGIVICGILPVQAAAGLYLARVRRRARARKSGEIYFIV